MKSPLKRTLSLTLVLSLLLSCAPWSHAFGYEAPDQYDTTVLLNAETEVPEDIPASEEAFVLEAEAPQPLIDAEESAVYTAQATEGDFSYTTDGSSITITGYTGEDPALVIPAEIDGLPVTSIGMNAFWGRTDLTSVTFPASITAIGTSSFYNCSALAEVTFSDPCESLNIGMEAFHNCDALTQLVLPVGLTTMGHRAFGNCDALTSVTIPSSLEKIETYRYSDNTSGPFYGCSALESVLFNEDPTIIIPHLLEGSGLKEFTFPESVTQIGDYAFRDCKNLTTAILPDNVTAIGNSAYANCTSLTMLSCDTPQMQVGSGVLDNCSKAEVVCGNRSFLGVCAVQNDLKLSLYPDSSPHKLLSDHSTYLINSTTAISGNYLQATVKYSFQNPAAITYANLELYFPENIVPVDGSIYLNNESVTYTLKDDLLTVPLSAKGGRLELSLRIYSAGDIKSCAIVRTNLGTEVVQVISEPLPDVTLSVPDRTHESSVTVTGIARSGAEVALYVDDLLHTTVKADLSGSFTATLSLPITDPDRYQIFDIRAESGESYSRSQLRYSKDTPKLTEFMMYYNNHSNTSLNLLESRTKRPHLTFNPARAITLTAKFENGEMLDQVWFTSSRGGITHTIPATFTDGQYVAVLTQDDYNGTPGTLGVEYSLKRKPLYADEGIEAVNKAAQAADELIDDKHVTVRELDKADVDVPDGLNLDAAQEITVDMGSALNLPGIASSLIRVEKYSYVTPSSGGILNSGVPITDTSITAIMPTLGLTTVYRSGSAPLKPYSPAVSSTDGYNRFTVKDKSGNQYNIAYKASGSATDDDPVGDYICLVEDISNNEVIKFVVEAGANKNAEAIVDALENAGAFYETVGIVYDLYQIEKDSADLEKQIRQRFHGEEQEEALRKAKELKHNRQDFTLAMALIGSGLGAAGVLTGPAGWGMMALLFAMSASSEFFWESRTNSILGGIFGAEYIVDPSGYVYEAVTTNRVPGVTATAYWIAEPEEDDLKEFYAETPDEDEMGTVWSAEDYGQTNPLLTDTNGAYAWDVPAGWWRVRYEKDGYETTHSAWLPVPPPQLEVNIPIVSYAVPTLEAVSAETGAVKVTFSKYMRPETVKQALTIDGHNATVSWPTYETDADGTVYAKTFTLIPTEPLTENSTVTVRVTDDALSYAGTAAAVCTMDASVGGTPKLKLQSAVQVLSGETVTIPFTVLNVEQPVVSVCVTPSSVVTAQATVDADGNGQLTVQAQLPATATVTLSVDGTELTASAQIQSVSVPVPVEPKIVAAEWDHSGSVCVDFTCDDEALVIAAVYSETGRFLGMQTRSVSSGELLTLTGLPAGDTCRVFLLDPGYTPLAPSLSAH